MPEPSSDRPTQARRAVDALERPELAGDGNETPVEAAPPSASLARVLRTYRASRAAIGLGLLGVHVVLVLSGTRVPGQVLVLCTVYALQALSSWWMWGRLQSGSDATSMAARRRQWLGTIGVDLLAFSALHGLSSGTTFSHAALLVLPVLMAGVMSPRLLALGTAAGVTLLLLAVAGRDVISSSDGTGWLLQSALVGLGMFAIAWLSSEITARLLREERAARGSLELARQQASLNRLVIDEMVDGLLVVDRRQRVRAANPAARALLAEEGLAPPAPFSLDERHAWRDLSRAVVDGLSAGRWPEEGREEVVDFGGGHRRSLRVRMRFTREPLPGERRGAADPLAVVLLEDVRTARARLRQEKLAAMGRVSAGVAHEIRNPLAAIAQANALLLEDELDPTHRRLACIVADNVERLRRLVDDVMEIAPGAAPVAVCLDAVALITRCVDEWTATVAPELAASGRWRLELPDRPLGVWFDAEHLRRVLVNLLDNANRHAGQEPGAIVLRLAPIDALHAELAVLSDGPPIPPEVERHLFEPFSSTRSRGTGLGLYICRELCERYDAGIEYRPQPSASRWRNAFVVSLRRGALPGDDAPASVTT